MTTVVNAGPSACHPNCLASAINSVEGQKSQTDTTNCPSNNQAARHATTSFSILNVAVTSLRSQIQRIHMACHLYSNIQSHVTSQQAYATRDDSACVTTLGRRRDRCVLVPKPAYWQQQSLSQAMPMTSKRRCSLSGLTSTAGTFNNGDRVQCIWHASAIGM